MTAVSSFGRDDEKKRKNKKKMVWSKEGVGGLKGAGRTGPFFFYVDMGAKHIYC